MYHLAEFRLGTGKKHQIRKAAAFALGAPIFADHKYGYDTEAMARDLMRRSFKYTKLQEMKLLERSILLHSKKLEVPTQPDTE